MLLNKLAPHKSAFKLVAHESAFKLVPHKSAFKLVPQKSVKNSKPLCQYYNQRQPHGTHNLGDNGRHIYAFTGITDKQDIIYQNERLAQTDVICV